MYINIINIVIDIIYRISKEKNLCDLTYIFRIYTWKKSLF